MRSSRGLAVLPLALSLVLAGCTSFTQSVSGQTPAAATASSTAKPEARSIDWTDCDKQLQPLIKGKPGADRALTFQCGRTDVPISYAEPRGATLPLFLVRVRLAGQTDPIGSLVITPGGPGASGAEAAIGLAIKLPEEVLRRFDLVGFDPRGVGLS